MLLVEQETALNVLQCLKYQLQWHYVWKFVLIWLITIWLIVINPQSTMINWFWLLVNYCDKSWLIKAINVIQLKNSFWLFQVPADLQNEVLMSLLNTDPDVVDYLLRRRTSHYSWVVRYRPFTQHKLPATSAIISRRSCNIYCVLSVCAVAQVSSEPRSPSPWLSDVCPVTP